MMHLLITSEIFTFVCSKPCIMSENTWKCLLMATVRQLVKMTSYLYVVLSFSVRKSTCISLLVCLPFAANRSRISRMGSRRLLFE